MVFSRRTAEIEAAIAAAVGKILDTREKRLVEAWVEAWDGVSGELGDALYAIASAVADGEPVTPSMLVGSRRLQAAVEALADSLATVAGEAAEGIAVDLRAAVRTGEVGTAAMITDQLPDVAQMAASVVAADPGQITEMLNRSIENITRDMAAMPVEQAAIIRAELNRGIAVGANPRETARRMVRRMEGRFNYGLTRALVASRTETLDAHRAASQATELANSDVVAEWQWLTHVDPRTCRACIAQHGKTFPLDEPGPIDHHQGRCARVPVTKSWAELGFPDIEEPAPLVQSAEDEFAAMTENEQRQILGPDWEAWSRGDYPMGAWVTVRRNENWRDSIAPTRA